MAPDVLHLRSIRRAEEVSNRRAPREEFLAGRPAGIRPHHPINRMPRLKAAGPVSRREAMLVRELTGGVLVHEFGDRFEDAARLHGIQVRIEVDLEEPFAEPGSAPVVFLGMNHDAEKRLAPHQLADQFLGREEFEVGRIHGLISQRKRGQVVATRTDEIATAESGMELVNFTTGL